MQSRQSGEANTHDPLRKQFYSAPSHHFGEFAYIRSEPPPLATRPTDVGHPQQASFRDPYGLMGSSPQSILAAAYAEPPPHAKMPNIYRQSNDLATTLPPLHSSIPNTQVQLPSNYSTTNDASVKNVSIASDFSTAFRNRPFQWPPDAIASSNMQDPMMSAQPTELPIMDARSSSQQEQQQQQQQQQQPQPQPQQQLQQSMDLNNLKPYGCDVPGCYESFPASSALFYHMKSAHPNLEGIEKPFRCAMPNCTKRYKNINGLQYHLRDAKGSSGHPSLSSIAEDGSGESTRPEKSYLCQAAGCKKAYRTAHGLRHHQNKVHNILPSPTPPVYDDRSRNMLGHP